MAFLVTALTNLFHPHITETHITERHITETHITGTHITGTHITGTRITGTHITETRMEPLFVLYTLACAELLAISLLSTLS